MVAVPVVRPVPSRNVLVPLLSVVTVPVMRPLASRNVVEGCADAVVANMRERQSGDHGGGPYPGGGGGPGNPYPGGGSTQPGGTQPDGTYGP